MRREIWVVVAILIVGSILAAVAGYATSYPCSGLTVRGEKLSGSPEGALVANYVAFRTDPNTVVARFDRGVACGDGILMVRKGDQKDGWYVYRGPYRRLLIVHR